MANQEQEIKELAEWLKAFDNQCPNYCAPEKDCDECQAEAMIKVGYRKSAPSEKLVEKEFDYHKEDGSIAEGLTPSEEFTEAFHKKLAIEEILSDFWQKSKDSKTPEEFQTHLHSATRSLSSLLPEMKGEDSKTKNHGNMHIDGAGDED